MASTRRRRVIAASCVLLAALVALAAAPALAPRAGAQTDVQGQLNRGRAALQLKKYDEAVARFGPLARAGNPDAQFYMGRLTSLGLGVPQDLAKATEWFRLAAQQGHVEAEAVLGLNYMEGIGVSQSYPEAARWSTRAAEQGHGGAAYNLAKMYATGGPGLAADRALSEKWAKVAMAQGFPDPLRAHAEAPKRAPEAVTIAQEGDRLFNAGDLAGAARAYTRCAQMGDATCERTLGWLYETGKGVEKNLVTAVRWYRASAEQNDPKAEDTMGNVYQLGIGVLKNCKTAVEWYARGALQNDQYNLYSLARMYHYGFGVKEDRAKAHALYRESAALGNPKAREALATFNQFSWPDKKSADIYGARVDANVRAIRACQATYVPSSHPISCLIPGADWNPKTWENC